MVQFIPVEPEEIPNVAQGARGKLSYPIIKSFMEANIPLAKLDKATVPGKRTNQSLVMTLSSYVRTHDHPIKIFQRNGDIYFLRLDLNPDGSKRDPETQGDIIDLTPEYISRKQRES